MKLILKLIWKSNKERKRAKCELHKRPLFKIIDGDSVRYRCADLSCKGRN